MAHLHEITFYKTKDSTIPMEHLVYDLLGSWYQNGQTLNDNCVYVKGGVYISYVGTDDTDSLDEKYANQYVKEAMGKVSYNVKYCGELAESKGCCSCKNPSCYELYTNTCNASSMKCGDCKGAVPLYRLPYLDGGKNHFRLTNWTEMYMHMKELWFASYYDRYTYRQLTHIDSILVKEGREICKAMEMVLCKSVYYNISYSKRVPKVCPSCGKEWRRMENLDSEEYICEECRLIGMGGIYGGQRFSMGERIF